MKTCTKCKKEKSENQFYSYGFNICKECKIERAAKWIKEHPVRVKQHQKPKSLYREVYYREWYARNGRKRSKKYQNIIDIWQKNNKEKMNVYAKIYHAIKKGLITRPLKCSICERGETRIYAHHEDYKKPFEIIWVCASCHKKIHIGKICVDF